jgi:hypothetical protein
MYLKHVFDDVGFDQLEFRSRIMLRTWRRLSSRRFHGTRRPTLGFESRVSALQLVTGSRTPASGSPEPADKNVCATTVCGGCTRIYFGVRVESQGLGCLSFFAGGNWFNFATAFSKSASTGRGCASISFR